MSASYSELNGPIGDLETAMSALAERHSRDLNELYNLKDTINKENPAQENTVPNKPAGDVQDTLKKLNAIDSEIKNVRKKMGEMQGYYNEIFTDLKKLQGKDSPTPTKEEINSWKETIEFLTAVANTPDKTQAIQNLEFHAYAKLNELSQADSRLGIEKARFWGKVLLITAVSLLIVGAIALTVGLAVLTGGASLALQCVAIAALGLAPMPAIGGGFLSLIKSPTYNALKKENTTDNLKEARKIKSEEEPIRETRKHAKGIANTAAASANGLLAARHAVHALQRNHSDSALPSEEIKKDSSTSSSRPTRS